MSEEVNAEKTNDGKKRINANFVHKPKHKKLNIIKKTILRRRRYNRDNHKRENCKEKKLKECGKKSYERKKRR